MSIFLRWIKVFFISIFTFFLSVWIVLWWTWLIPSNGDMISISKWVELVWELNSAKPIPYISNSSQIMLPSSTNSVITLNWDNFTPTSTVVIPFFDWTINTTSIISPYRIDLDITSWPAENDYDIVVSNNLKLNTDWVWNWVWLLHVWPVIWVWSAWTYTEDFETNTLWSWIEVTWLTANVSFQPVTWGTPSGATWPNNAAAGTYYAYTEASNPNFPSMTFAIETDNFRHAQSISFDYHMYWVAMGDIKVQTLYNSVWTDVYTLSWQQQANQADAWINTWNIDLSWYSVEKIRLFSTSWTDYTSDVSIDNVVINSI